MQTDVKLKTLNSLGSGVFAGIGPCRIKAIRFTASDAGFLTIVENPGPTPEFLIADLSFFQAGAEYLLFPGEGIRAESDPFVYGNNLSSVVIIYG